MSVGFRKPDPQPPVREDVSHRRAHAAVRRLSHGLELRAYVDGGLLISHLHKRGAVDALQAQSAQHLDDFKNLNWLPVRS